MGELVAPSAQSCPAPDLQIDFDDCSGADCDTATTPSAVNAIRSAAPVREYFIKV